MNEITLKLAIDEAKRFIRVTKELENRIKSDKEWSICGTKESGAVKRASLDLTRALANLRKSS